MRDVVADLAFDPLDLVRRVPVLRHEPLPVAVEGIPLRPLLEQLARHVAHVVVGAVAVHAHRAALDQRGPAAGPRPLGGRGGRGEHRLDVVAVDRQPLEAVGVGALDRVDRELELVRRRVGEAVVLEDENHRRAVNAGEVHRLVPLPGGGRALAEEGQRHPRLPAHLERERHSGGHERHVGQHRDHPDAPEPAIAEVHVPVLATGHAVGAAHEVGEVAVRGHAAHEVRAEVAVQDAQPVLGPQRPRRPDRDRLLAAPVVERAGNLALLVERESTLLGGAHHQHEPPQPRAVLAREGDFARGIQPPADDRARVGSLHPVRLSVGARGWDLHVAGP